MGLQLLTYDIYVARDGLELSKAVEAGEGSGYDVHRFQIMHADLLVAEKNGTKYAATQASGTRFSTFVAWIALKRMGVEVPDFPLFGDRVITMDDLNKPKDKKQATQVDPTTPVPDTG